MPSLRILQKATAPLRRWNRGRVFCLSMLPILLGAVNGQPPVLQGQDLVVTITARGRGGAPHIGFMIEQSKGGHHVFGHA